jgi:hypothetical protein
MPMGMKASPWAGCEILWLKKEAFAADGLGRKQWDVPGGIDRSVSKNALESVSSRSMLSAWPYYCVMSICRFSICFITRAHIYSSVLWD